MKYTILQLKCLTPYMFMPYDYALTHNFSLRDYKEVYQSTINEHNDPIEETLEAIFVLFNMYRSQDFEGHSMSVSDIIKLDDGRLFYVNTVGFEEIK